MTALAAPVTHGPGQDLRPRILVFSTNNISDPGIDLAGSSHMHYSPGVEVISLPCTSGIRPSWILHAIEQGFDGVFIASDGDECAYLPDCAERASRIVGRGAGAAAGARATRRSALKMAAICSVCAEPFTKHVQQFSEALAALGPSASADHACDYDVLVVGSGIGGMESALKLGDMGYKVLLVEKEASVGGKMILLSKVFPTLDCASCISTPEDGGHDPPPEHHRADLQPRWTGSRATATAASTATVTRKGAVRRRGRPAPAASSARRPARSPCPDQFNADLVARRAAYIAFPQAVPKKAVIDRAGTSPCSFACPAGIKAHGYVSLIRSGEYEKAFQLVLDATPLVGTLGRACYAPCEGECTRGSLEGTLPIRRLKRFVADRHYAAARRTRASTVAAAERQARRDRRLRAGRPDRRLAARPQGLRASRSSRRRRRPAASCAWPSPPTACRPRSWSGTSQNVTALGVEIATNTPGRRPRGAPRRRLRRRARGDRHAALDAASASRARTLAASSAASTSCARSSSASAVDLAGKRVVVVGGGNVAMDAARTARRLGARERDRGLPPRPRARCRPTTSRSTTPRREGVALQPSRSPRSRSSATRRARSTGLRCTRMAPRRARRVRPPPPGADPRQRVRHRLRRRHRRHRHGARHGRPSAARRRPTATAALAAPTRSTLPDRRVPYVFAAGDVVNGPSDITRAVGAGPARRAHDRPLAHGRTLDGFDDRLPVVDKAAVLARQKALHAHGRPRPAGGALAAAPADFARDRGAADRGRGPRRRRPAASTAASARSASECVTACPVGRCIDLQARDQQLEVEVGAVVVATGFKLFPADLKPEYGFGTLHERHHRDADGPPARPDPAVQHDPAARATARCPSGSPTSCAPGSRDETVGNPLCSRFCCMYSIKQNQLIMGALPLADVTVHYMDIRAAGQALRRVLRAGARRWARTTSRGASRRSPRRPNGNLILRYEDIENGGGLVEAEYDLVVLAVGVQPNRDAEQPLRRRATWRSTSATTSRSRTRT